MKIITHVVRLLSLKCVSKIRSIQQFVDEKTEWQNIYLYENNEKSEIELGYIKFNN